MKFLFRTDASIEIGSGHVMRCLTLAKALKSQGHEVYFIIRDLPGHLADTLEKNHIPFTLLTVPCEIVEEIDETQYRHSKWLPANQHTDFLQCLPIIQAQNPDWIVVDHYALSDIWEKQAKKCNVKILVIDDLADRKHCCDILVDQSVLYSKENYLKLIDQEFYFIGQGDVILREEFRVSKKWHDGQRSLFICMGGVDAEGVTLKLLRKIFSDLDLYSQGIFYVNVAIGRNSPHLKEFKYLSVPKEITFNIHIDSSQIANLMVTSKLSILSCGTMILEACSLGVPSIGVIIAENQSITARYLSNKQAIELVNLDESIAIAIKKICENSEIRNKLSKNAQTLINNNGITTILEVINQ